MNSNEIFQQLQNILSKDFEIPSEKITLEARLYDDLDLDSIDLVDLIIHVQDLIGQKVGPDEFKSARTVQDVIDVVIVLLSKE
jgi:acyl carrier protein